MATILKLLAGNQLFNITVPLKRSEFQSRWVYALPTFVDWKSVELPKLQQGRLKATETPEEQFDNILFKWITGKEIRYGAMFKDLSPIGDEVWELKTVDLRIFGWMFHKDKFVAVFGDYADNYKPPSRKASYNVAMAKVVSARKKLDLDQPKFITGVYDDIVST